MVVYEVNFKEDAYNEAFDLVEEAKHNAKKTKMTLCKLEDAIYDCYEASKEEHEDYEPEEEFELGLRGKKGYRHDEHYGMRDEEYDEEPMQYGMRRMNRRSRKSLRMRRDRMGRYAA